MLCATIFLVQLILQQQHTNWAAAGDDRELRELKTMIETCEFITERLAPEGILENLAVITIGTAIEDAQVQAIARHVNPFNNSQQLAFSSPNKAALLAIKLFNKQKAGQINYNKKYQILQNCVHGLVQHASQRGNKLFLHIEEIHLNKFSKLLKNGRQFAKRIVYVANFEIKKQFFINLIEMPLKPMINANAMIEDIGIATTTIDRWDREILMETLDENHFDEMIYYHEPIPHWQVLYELNELHRAKLHFCQWAQMGHKFRMWLYPKGDEQQSYLARKYKSFMNGETDQTPTDICFLI
ncbi:hypothetical protein niasHS_016223 [Heterodera schachtii]|uniref:Uncharacterized protein n=1 Tax=Heterodera schachtii TaxID=97005 RepID=A0ABD2HSI7_HETSC